MLKLRFKNNKHSAVWLVEPKVTIGQASGNDLVVDDTDVAPYHAEILARHEKLTLVNLEGKPVLVNGKPVAQSAELSVNDQLQVGNQTLEIIDPKQERRGNASNANGTGWSLKANHAALANRVFPISAETVIGRSKDCDITLAAAHLSRRHVKLFVENGLMYVRDLGSANGTFLNGERITEARVRRGDELRFDTLSFGVMGPPSEDLDKTSIRPIAAVKPQPADLGRRTSVESGAAGARRAQRPATKPTARPDVEAASQAGSVSNENGTGGGKLLWALGLALAAVLAAGLAWQLLGNP